jgi:ribosomal protein S7
MKANKINNSYSYINSYIKITNFKENIQFKKLLNQLETEKIEIDMFEDTNLFNKLVSLCVKKGKKKMALRQVLSSFLLLKQFFKCNPLYFLKVALLQMEPFVFLHKIPKGNKEMIYPRILPINIRINNSLYIIVNQAFNTCKNYKSFSVSLAYSVLENSMLGNIYQKKVKENIEIAELNKRNIKYKRRGQKIIPRLKRRDRFKLFKKIKIWKD